MVGFQADSFSTGASRLHDARALLPDLPITILTDGHRDPGLDRLLGPGPVRFVRAPVDDIVLGTLLSELLRPAGFELPYWALPAGGSRNAMHTVEFFEQQRAAIDMWGDDEAPPDSVAGE